MNKLSALEIAKLIEFIKEKPLMYNKADKFYKHLQKKEKIWKDIAEYVGADESDCKTAWKSLRDQFVKANKEMKGKSGQATTEKKKYKYYEQLLFLKDTLLTRERTSNFDNWMEESGAEIEPLIHRAGEDPANVLSDIDEEEDPFDIMMGPSTSDNIQQHSSNPNSNASSSSAPSKRRKSSSKEDDNLNEFLTEVLAEIKGSNCQQGDSDSFFLTLSAMAKRANLTPFQTRQIHRKLFNFLVEELDKIDET